MLLKYWQLFDMHNWVLQVRLFDSVYYLKAFGAGDVWVSVGWSSDVIPAAKRMSNVAVIVPKSGSSLWADLWVCIRNLHEEILDHVSFLLHLAFVIFGYQDSFVIFRNKSKLSRKLSQLLERFALNSPLATILVML